MDVHLLPLDYIRALINGELVLAMCGEPMPTPIKFGDGDLCQKCLTATA